MFGRTRVLELEHTGHNRAGRPFPAAWRAETRARSQGQCQQRTMPAWIDVHRAVADLAGRLVTVDPEEMDEALNGGLRDLAQALLVDRALVWHERPCRPVTTHYWSQQPEAGPPDVSRLAALPFIATSLLASRPVWFRQLDEVADAADRDVLRESGFGSAAIVSLPSAAEIRRHARAGLQLGRRVVRVVAERYRASPRRRGPRRPGVRRKAQVLALQPSARNCSGCACMLRATGCDAAPAHTGGRLAYRRVGEPQRAASVSQAEQVAETPSTVLLLGETGVGKEVFAQAIHELSARRHQP